MTPKDPIDLSKLDVPETGGGSYSTPATYDVDRQIRRIKGMLVGDDYEYAADTLRGILATIERTRNVTERQTIAIDNIADKPFNNDRRRSRRGGGW